MEERKIVHVTMLLFSTLLGAAGQLLFKVGVTSGIVGLAVLAALGLLAYLASTVIYLYVLSRTHLSWAYGFSGLSYIFASVIAFLFMGEAVPTLRWYGILIITLGTVLIGVS